MDSALVSLGAWGSGTTCDRGLLNLNIVLVTVHALQLAPSQRGL